MAADWISCEGSVKNGGVDQAPLHSVVQASPLISSVRLVSQEASSSFVAPLQLRFLLPVLPVFNVPAAAALASLWKNRDKSAARSLLLKSAVAALALNCVVTALFTAVSRQNYPGGHALARLHEIEGAMTIRPSRLRLPTNTASPCNAACLVAQGQGGGDCFVYF